MELDGAAFGGEDRAAEGRRRTRSRPANRSRESGSSLADAQGIMAEALAWARKESAKTMPNRPKKQQMIKANGESVRIERPLAPRTNRSGLFREDAMPSQATPGATALMIL